MIPSQRGKTQTRHNPLIKKIIRLTLIIFGVLAALALLAGVAFRLVNVTNGTLISSGEKRVYLLYVADSYDPSVPTPLVISIHGFAEWPAHQRDISHWNALADEYGFIVVYPSGTRFPLRWRVWGESGSENNPMLDVTFIADLIDKLESEYNIDPDHIYANGLSNGGGMSFVLSCELSERIAAVGTVSGVYLYSWDRCSPSRAVPVVAFHGTADPVVPFEGGPSRSFDMPFPNVQEWVDALAQKNGCDESPLDLQVSGEVREIQYTNCAADVVFYTISGGGHGWPGGEPIPEWIVGYTTQEIDATRVMWEFFMQHPME